MCAQNTTTSPPTHTQTHTHRHHIPQPLQHSATYIWCWRVQGLRLAQASQPPADSGECSCSVWRVWMAEYSSSAFSAEINAPSFVRTYKSVHNCIPSHDHTRAKVRKLSYMYMHLDLRIDPNNCCRRSCVMTSCSLLIQLHALQVNHAATQVIHVKTVDPRGAC